MLLFRDQSLLLAPSSRTRVTKFSNSRGYRFFSAAHPISLHAPPPRFFVPPKCQEMARTGNRFPCVLFHGLRGHFGLAAHCSCLALLLPLLGIAFPRWMRENVRVKTQCFPLVGHQLRETSHEAARPQFERRPKVPASGPCRTCEARAPKRKFLVLTFFEVFSCTCSVWSYCAVGADVSERRLQRSHTLHPLCLNSFRRGALQGFRESQIQRGFPVPRHSS
jgi:hypothetical protein